METIRCGRDRTVYEYEILMLAFLLQQNDSDATQWPQYTHTFTNQEIIGHTIYGIAADVSSGAGTLHFKPSIPQLIHLEGDY